MTQTIWLSIGIPGCGKTTHALNLLTASPNRWKRINRDDLRLMLTGKMYEPGNREKENLVTKCAESLLLDALNSGYDVLLDNTHLDARSRASIHMLAKQRGDVNVVEQVFPVPLEIVLQRNNQRDPERVVPEDVIRDMAKRYHVDASGHFKNLKDATTYYEPNATSSNVQDSSLPRTVICDLDGTLALLNGRCPYDASTCENDLLNVPIANVLERYIMHDDGDKHVIFMSGRSSKYREQTKKFIQDNMALDYDYELYMRKEGDMRPDHVVKKELYNQHVAGKFHVDFCLDDRDSIVRLWRSMGITTLQVDYGNF